ncbi:tautomerase family protein [Aminobacter sp. Piv2-1]|uniref:tautomerase family protein n=1 Tax=Aminobacter sp. Piv2-1 TaxID=3031122 RepID=UPI0030A63FD1
MPYVDIKVTRESVTREQKSALIKGATGLLVDMLGEDRATTFLVIDEVDLEVRGVGGMPVRQYRDTLRKG